MTAAGDGADAQTYVHGGQGGQPHRSAAALTYCAVLSVFPAIALVSIIGLVGDPKTVVARATDVVASIGPSSAVDTFRGPLQTLTASKGSAGIALIAQGVAAA